MAASLIEFGTVVTGLGGELALFLFGMRSSPRVAHHNQTVEVVVNEQIVDSSPVTETCATA